MLKSETNSQVLSADGETPIRLVTLQGIPFWQASGRTFPVVAGAEDPPPAGAKTEDPPKPQAGEGDEGGEFDKDRALATIKKLRDTEKALKTQLKELEPLKAKVQEQENAQKSEADKLREQIADLERKSTDAQKKLTESQNRIAIERAATKAGAADADDVFRLLDSSDFDIDDDGTLKNADKLVEDLIKSKPYLVAKTTNGVPATPRSNGTQSHEDRVKENEQKLRASGLYGSIG